MLSVCSEFHCKYIHSVGKVCIFMPEGHPHPTLLSWLEKVKRHLAADSCFTSDKVLLVISLPHFFLIFPNVPLRHHARQNGLLWTYLLSICANFFLTYIISPAVIAFALYLCI